MNRPRVLFLCPSAWGLRNVVGSGLLDLLDARGIQGVVLSTAGADNALAEAFDGSGGYAHAAMLAPVERANWRRAQRMSERLLKASHARRHRLTSHAILERWHRRDARWPSRARAATVRGLAAVGSVGFVLGWQMRLAEELAARAGDTGAIDAQLRQLAPALVVASSCVVRDEHPYLRAARALGIPTLGCVLSFDNVTSKGLLPACDDYAVWSPRMRDEVLALRPGVRRDSVHVTGSPQFDFHRRAASRWPRRRLLSALGLGPDARFLLWGANAATYTPAEPLLVAAVSRACAANPALREHHIVVRLHPADDPARWNALAGARDRVRLAPGADRRLWSVDGQALLVSSLLHADACLNMASTLSLDAALLDTPVVCTGLGDGEGSVLDAGARALHATTHYAPIVASGGVRVATTVAEVVRELAAYVRDPGRDRAARARLAAELCGTPDGHATDRLAALVASLVGPRPAGRRPTDPRPASPLVATLAPRSPAGSWSADAR